jgi:hypothetical protein
VIFPTCVQFKTFRFGVEGGNGLFSNIWFVQRKNDDLYIGSRNSRGTTKISLHSTGVCHVKGNCLGTVETISRWKRIATPNEGVAHVLSVIFPTDFLNSWKKLGVTSQVKTVTTISVAPTGSSMEFGIFYSRQSPVAIEGLFEKNGFPIANARLSCGDYVYVVVRQASFDKALIPLGPNSVKNTFVELPTFGILSKFDAIYWNAPIDENMVAFVNLEGLNLKFE